MNTPSSLYQAKIATPFAVLGVRTEGNKVAEIVFLSKKESLLGPQNLLAKKVCEQIKRYLKDSHYAFNLPLKQVGTPYQRRVWQKIKAIPTGATRSYGAIAKELNSGPRAVGQACGANYFPLIIPCHRVTASQGIGGFANHDNGFHLSVKRWLLAYEKEKAK